MSFLAQTSLNDLHDIVSPEPISWWPLAPGWWWLLGALVVAAIWLGWRVRRRYREGAYRRAALSELEQMEDGISEIPGLLKRVALVAYSRTQVASLTGDAWVRFLNDKAPAVSFEDAWFRMAHGEVAANVEDTANLREQAAAWIREHRVGEAAKP